MPLERKDRVVSTLLAFVGGFNVMLLEMCAFRVLPNTFGSSVYVTGILLALIMIALSLGYSVGGAFSTRTTSLTYLFASMLGAVIYVHLTSVVFDHRILDFTFSLFKKQGSPLAAISLTVLILYFPPMLALSQISPFLIAHLSRKDLGPEHVGQTAGRLMSVSTIGSILGTLAPTFLLIPTLGVIRTTLVFEGSLAVTAIIGFVLFRQRLAAAATTALYVTCMVTSTVTQPAPTPGQRIIYDAESMYGDIKIISRTDSYGERLIYAPNRTYEHSSVYPSTPLKNSSIALDYLTFMTLAPGKRVLVLGTALGAALAMASDIDPSVHITGVEIDPQVIEVSKRYLPQLNRPNITLIADDARVFLKQDEGHYDFVLVDLFAGGFLPPHCVTQEFFSLVRERMAPNGVMFINSNMPELQALEDEPDIVRPVRHLESAIFNAGFPQLLRSDFAVNGHMTAFLAPRTIEQHREALRAQARRTDLPIEFRAQLALESFSISEIPTDRTTVEPFTDDWVPDSVIHRKENTPGHLAAAAKLPEPSHTTALELARWRFREIGRTPGMTFSEFSHTSGQGRFCKDITDWASVSTEPVSELFRYFTRADLRSCESTVALLPTTPETSRQSSIRDLLLAAAMVQEGKTDAAWPHLARAIDNPVLTN